MHNSIYTIILIFFPNILRETFQKWKSRTLEWTSVKWVFRCRLFCIAESWDITHCQHHTTADRDIFDALSTLFPSPTTSLSLSPLKKMYVCIVHTYSHRPWQSGNGLSAVTRAKKASSHEVKLIWKNYVLYVWNFLFGVTHVLLCIPCLAWLHKLISISYIYLRKPTPSWKFDSEFSNSLWK